MRYDKTIIRSRIRWYRISNIFWRFGINLINCSELANSFPMIEHYKNWLCTALKAPSVRILQTISSQHLIYYKFGWLIGSPASRSRGRRCRCGRARVAQGCRRTPPGRGWTAGWAASRGCCRCTNHILNPVLCTKVHTQTVHCIDFMVFSELILLPKDVFWYFEFTLQDSVSRTIISVCG